MNILPKKSWHVLSKKNIERVRRDEAQARAEEEEKAGRAALAEQEAQMGTLRKRARDRDGGESEERWDHRGRGRGRGRGGTRGEGGSRKERRKECSVTDASGHINFFTDLQKGVGLQVGNADRDKEMKQEQEKLEKRIGLLNYLVDKDKSDSVPWYIKSHEAKSSHNSNGDPMVAVHEAEAKRKSAKAEHRKELMDPLLSMQHYVETKKKTDLEMAGGGSSDKKISMFDVGRHSLHGRAHHDRPSSSTMTDTNTTSSTSRGTSSTSRGTSSTNTTVTDTNTTSSTSRGTSSTNTTSSTSRGTSSSSSSRHGHKYHDQHTEQSKIQEKKDKKKTKKKEKREKAESELETLRRERRKREEGERSKAEALIRGLERGVEKGVRETMEVQQVQGRYNSQFNPHLARQKYTS